MLKDEFPTIHIETHREVRPFQWVTQDPLWFTMERRQRALVRTPKSWSMSFALRASERRPGFVEIASIEVDNLSSQDHVAWVLSMFLQPYCQLLPDLSSQLHSAIPTRAAAERVHSAHVKIHSDGVLHGCRAFSSWMHEKVCEALLQIYSPMNASGHVTTIMPKSVQRSAPQVVWEAGRTQHLKLGKGNVTLELRVAATDYAHAMPLLPAGDGASGTLSKALSKVEELRKGAAARREAIRISIQEFIDSTRSALSSGRGEFGSLDANREFAQALNSLLKESSFWVESEDGVRGTLVCLDLAGKNNGYFAVHSSQKGKTVRSKSSKELPAMRVVDKADPPKRGPRQKR